VARIDRNAFTTDEGRRATSLVGLYTLTILTSAALLFLVQPMFARMVLPLLGGSPAVWNTAVVFYQVVLLAGYAYAYVVTRWLALRPQLLLHLGVLLLPFAVLPSEVPEGWVPPTTEEPIVWLLALLAVGVGLPFFVVSATAPLLQKWFAGSRHALARDPYFLYAASNLGSLLALLAYPLIVERWLGVGEQSRWWAWGYLGLSILIAGCAAAAWRTGKSADAGSESAPADSKVASITWRDRLRWMILAAIPVSFMLSVTTYISTDIAAIPLLWVIPLALYLLTFILTFASRPVPERPLIRVLPFALVLLAFLLATARDITSWPLILAHLATFVLVSLVAHGELARRRPGPQRLTEFYFLISLGGALGGIFNAIVAPVIFEQIAEYPLTLMLAAAWLPQVAAATTAGAMPRQKRPARPHAHKRNRPGTRATRFSRAKMLDVLLPAATFGLTAILLFSLLEPDQGLTWESRLVAFGAPALMTLAFIRRPVRFALSLGAIVLASGLYNGKGTYLYADRTFFGVNRVLRFGNGGYHTLEHGNTMHGAQSLEPARSREPLTYFNPRGPLGDVFQSVRRHPAGGRVAVVGLGAGSVACYRAAGEAWTFYEIDPAVVRIASDPRYFTYLQHCAPDARIVVGDARLRLAGAKKSEYGLIIIDAYSSDAIPVHLLTREAFELYLDKLAPDGMLVLNISNLHFELKTVIGNVAKALKLAVRVRDDQQLTEAEENRGWLASQWAVLARTTADLGTLAADRRWAVPEITPGTSVWTDDFNNLFSVLKWTR
jgi:spermidine synthase